MVRPLHLHLPASPFERHQGRRPPTPHSCTFTHLNPHLTPPPIVSVVLACRSIARGEAFKQELEDAARSSGQAAPRLEVMELDLNSLASVRAFASAWIARGLPLHVLVNNAGIFAMSAPRATTADGFEAHLGTNHLGHFLLTLLLLPSMKNSAAKVSVYVVFGVGGWGGAAHWRCLQSWRWLHACETFPSGCVCVRVRVRLGRW
jgi:NAD(P)-dependent dehydrogenase (short-subunit alcohol dehydrogenase family)